VSPGKSKPSYSAVGFEPNSFQIARPVVTNTNDLSS
jgi:hypothetical protein